MTENMRDEQPPQRQKVKDEAGGAELLSTLNASTRRRQNLLLGGVAAILLAGAAWFLLGTDDTGKTDTGKTDTDTTGGLDGEQLFLTNCSGCHGTDAMGSNNGPPLDREVQMLSDNQLIGIMLNGEGRMLAIEVSVEEAQAIVDYLRTLFP